MDFTSHFLINLLVILLSLIVIQFWINNVRHKPKYIEIVMFLSFSISIALCMLFPFKIKDGLFFDLRLIPLILGCLYCKKFTSAGLTVLCIGIRLFEGLHDSWLPVSSTILFYFIAMYLQPVYNRIPKIRKISLSSALVSLMSIWILSGNKIFLHGEISVSFAIAFVSIQTMGMVIVTYVLETIIEQHLLVVKMLRMEKVEIASHLAASISHEVRNPLTTTRGFLQLMEESEDLPAAQKYYLKIAIEELDRAESIIQDYLTFAKPMPESDKLETVNVEREIDRSVNILKPLANMNVVEIHSQVEPCFIKGHSGNFQQVLVNILKNSIEAMPTGGILSIKAFVDRSYAVIKICDEGIGMTPLQISRLGEPYFSTKGLKGTGLGMMVVFRIVESMNGTIQIESKPAKGTKIILRFPVTQ